MAPSLAVADGMVIVPSSNGKLYALDQSSGSRIWNITVGGTGTCPLEGRDLTQQQHIILPPTPR